MSNSVIHPVLGFGMLLMLGFFLLLALRQTKEVTSLFKYHLFGDDLKKNRFSGSLISTNASLSGAFLLILYYGFLYGPWAFIPVWLFWITTQYTSAWTINRTQSVLSKYGGWWENRATLHEFLGLVFESSKARLMGAVLSLVSYLGLMAAEIVLATHVLSYLFPDSARIPFTTLPASPFYLIVAIMFSIIIYNVLSGFRGTVQTDFAQWFIMSLMIVVVLAFVIAKWSTWSSGYTAIFNAPSSSNILNALLNPDRQGFGLYASFLFSNIVFWGLWWPGAMDQWQRCAAARTPKLSLNREWGTIGAVPIIYFGVLTLVFQMAGVWLRVSHPEAQPSPQFLASLIVDVHGWAIAAFGGIVALALTALLFWGLVCAAMSTIDSYVMTASQTFFVDIVHYKRGKTLVELNATDDQEQKLLRQARAFTVFIPLLVTGLALVFSFASDVYALIYFSFSFMFALLPPLFTGLKGWARPAARFACEASLIAGGLTCLAYVAILYKLERAIRMNDGSAIANWYQAVYWWPTAITVVGALVLWVMWPKEKPQEDIVNGRIVA